MKVFNLYGDDWERAGARRLSPAWADGRAGDRSVGDGATVYELAPGQRSFPYHYEYGNEEWLPVVAGRPSLRTPEGERELSAGDIACFPEGPGGAHQVRNGTDDPVRVMFVSTKTGAPPRDTPRDTPRVCPCDVKNDGKKALRTTNLFSVLATVADMPRQPRSYLDDGVYHVTGRATGGERLFVVDIDRVEFIDLFCSTAYGFNWLCRAYCLMGTHYHLILEASRETLSAGMQRLNGVYAQRFNYRHRRRGRLFEGRFAAYVVRDDRHLEAACRYVLENPVRAGLCERAEEWPWSGLALPR